MSYQDELNRLNGTSNLSVRDCLITLSGTADTNISTTAAANLYASTSIGVSHQDAMNGLAGVTLTTDELLSKQDAAKLI